MTRKHDAETVGVVGAGLWGTTLADHLARGPVRSLVWEFQRTRVEEIQARHTNEEALPGYKLSSRVSATSDMAELCDRTRILLVAVPSLVFRETLKDLGRHIRADHLIVHSTKGLETTSGARMSEIVRDETCCKRFGVLSGPNLASEILAKAPSAAVVASRYDEVVEEVQRLVSRPHFRVYGSHDLVGVELAGAIKNVLSILMGMARGMGLGDNTVSLVVTRGLAEMIRIGARLGAEPQTMNGIAGIGDLIGTAMSPHSRNHQVGERIGRGEPVAKVLASLTRAPEGVATVRGLHVLVRRHGIDAPLTEAAFRVLYKRARPARVLESLLAREPTTELDGTPAA